MIKQVFKYELGMDQLAIWIDITQDQVDKLDETLISVRDGNYIISELAPQKLIDNKGSYQHYLSAYTVVEYSDKKFKIEIYPVMNWVPQVGTTEENSQAMSVLGHVLKNEIEGIKEILGEESLSLISELVYCFQFVVDRVSITDMWGDYSALEKLNVPYIPEVIFKEIHADMENES